jgi:hypothetical protein
MVKLQNLLNANGFDLKPDGIVGPKTLSALTQYCNSNLEKRKWRIPTTGIVWIRTDKNLTNTFDDFAAVYVNGQCKYAVPCSTTAGDYYVFNPLTVGGITGTAIACEQQVIDAHQFVTSKNWKLLWLNGPYFMQVRPITIYRDGNKNRLIDSLIKTLGLYGINFHRGGMAATIGGWSAGCHIVWDNLWFEICKEFVHGQFIDYTLFEV